MTSVAEALACGEVALIATDTVYGLAALPGSPGFERIYELKGRPRSQPLPLLVADPCALDELASDVPAYARTLARGLWPGALTLVVTASTCALEHVEAAEDGTIALRCPDDDCLRTLIDGLGAPLACTSANLHGQPACTHKADLAAAFAQLPGFEQAAPMCPGSASSTIIKCVSDIPELVREGAIPFGMALELGLFGDTLPK